MDGEFLFSMLPSFSCDNCTCFLRVRRLTHLLAAFFMPVISGVRHTIAIEFMLCADMVALLIFILTVVIYKTEGFSIAWQMIMFNAVVVSIYLAAALYRGSKANVTQSEHVSSLVEWRMELRQVKWQLEDERNSLEAELEERQRNTERGFDDCRKVGEPREKNAQESMQELACALELQRREALCVDRTIDLIGDILDVLSSGDHCGVCRIYGMPLADGELIRLGLIIFATAVTLFFEVVQKR